MKRLNHIINHINTTEQDESINDLQHINCTIESNEYGGYLIAKILVSEGIKSIFTLTGGHISPMLVGCNKVGINVIDVRDEVTTVFAADAVGRITGRPGVAMVTAGPGLTNTITAVKNAQMAESPCIIFGGATAMLLKGRGSLQDIDQFALMKPHVKKCFTLKRIRDIIPTLRKAFYISNHGIPGPVFIETPLEILWPKTEIELSSGNNGNKNKNNNNNNGGWKSWIKMPNIADLYIKYHINRVFKDGFNDMNNIEMDDKYKYITLQKENNNLDSNIAYNLILNKLLNSSKPLIIIGSQTMLHPSLNNELIMSINELNIPIYLSGMSRGLLGIKHKLYFRHKRSISLSKCDFVILLGISCDFRLNYGRSMNKNSYLIHVNLDKNKLKINSDIRKRQLSINYDSCQFLIKLAQCKRDLGCNLLYKNWINDLNKRELQREYSINKTMEQEMKLNNNENTINTINLCRVLNNLIMDDEIYLIADGGDFVGTASYLVKPRTPLHWLDPGAFGTLGCGAGFALGIKSVNKNANIIMLYGDGSFGWSISEFDTFKRFKFGLIAIIGNDSCWHQMYRDQVRILKDTTATLLSKNTKYHKIIQGFDCKGFVATNINEFINAFKNAQKYAKQGIPVVINAIISKSQFREGSISL